MNLHHLPNTKCLSFALKTQRGFTLTELLVSMGLSLFVLAGVGSLFRAQTHTVKGQESRMEANEYALAVIDMVVRKSATLDISVHCLRCHGWHHVGSATSLTIQYDKDSNGACSGDEEIVVFAFDSANKNVTRNGVALSDGNVTASSSLIIRSRLRAAPQRPIVSRRMCRPAVAAHCRRTGRPVQKITIALTVAPKSTDSDFTGSPVTMSLTADMRNHGV